MFGFGRFIRKKLGNIIGINKLHTDILCHLEKAKKNISKDFKIELKALEENLNIFHLMRMSLSAYMLHQKTFLKFRGCFIDTTVFLIATGPSLNFFATPKFFNIPTNYVGVNSAFMYDKIELDYIFAQDYPAIKSYINEMNLYRPLHCIKFYGQCWYGSLSNINIPEYYAIKAKALRYIFDTYSWDKHEISRKICQNIEPCKDDITFTNDIAAHPMPASPSVSFSALNFIFYGCPHKVYLVGCDCSSNGHFLKTGQTAYSCTHLINAWRSFKDFATTFYPDTEIISVNPVGLKGMFRDVYTQAYLAEHPEIAAENPEILEDMQD